jgi:hypothetical protein
MMRKIEGRLIAVADAAADARVEDPRWATSFARAS